MYLVYNERNKDSKEWKPKFIKIIKQMVKNIKTDNTRLKTALDIEHIRSSKKNGHIVVIPRNTRAGFIVPKQFLRERVNSKNYTVRKYKK